MNFIKSIFKRKEPQVSLIQRITVIQLHTFCQFHSLAVQKPFQQQRIDQKHPMFALLVPQEETDYQIYQAEPDQSLFGLSLKFSLSESQIVQLNPDLSDQIFIGTRIKLPKGSIQKSSSKSLTQSPTKQTSPLGFLIQQKQKYKLTYMAGSMGGIRGYLTLYPSYLMFAPNLQDQANLDSIGNQRLLRFSSIIQIEDMFSCGPIVLPSQTIAGRKFGIEIILRNLGQKVSKLSSKNRQELKKIQSQRGAIAYIYLFIYQFNEKGRQLQEYLMMEKQTLLRSKLTEFINRNPRQYDTQRKSITFLPFFSIIEKQKEKNIWKTLNFTPQMTDPSQTLNSHIFLKVMQHVPDMYKMHDWKLIFSNSRDGTNFNTMLRNAQNIQPTLLVIKVSQDSQPFGVYLTDYLRYSGDVIFGRGEMFLFSGEKVFPWSQKNKFFTILDQKGLSVGLGEYNYGLFIDRSLRKGFSYSTITFDSPNLFEQPQFQVRRVQLWSPCIIQ